MLYKRVAGGSLRDRLLEQLAWPKEPVKTRFAGSVSSRRIVEGVGFEMAKVQRVRKWVSGATTNDVFMATVGGAVRRYLQECGDSLQAGLSAAVPASHQDILPGSDRGNKLNQHRVPLHVEIESGLARLRAIRQSAADTRQTADVIGHDLLRQLADELPTRITSAVVDSLLGDYLNIVVSTVRGPDVPLYLAGAQLNRFYPIGVVKNGVGLNITGFSYCGNLWATVVSCRKMIPDPDVFANCLRQSFDSFGGRSRSRRTGRARHGGSSLSATRQQAADGGAGGESAGPGPGAASSGSGAAGRQDSAVSGNALSKLASGKIDETPLRYRQPVSGDGSRKPVDAGGGARHLRPVQPRPAVRSASSRCSTSSKPG